MKNVCVCVSFHIKLADHYTEYCHIASHVELSKYLTTKYVLMNL